MADSNSRKPECLGDPSWPSIAAGCCCVAPVAVAVACQSPKHDTHSSEVDLADVSQGWETEVVHSGLID